MSTSDHTSPSDDKTLLHLGAGQGSKVEQIKEQSDHLRGKLAEELSQDTSHFDEDHVQLIKFHGMYQQDDRDERSSRRGAKAEKAYQFMLRSRIPGGALTAEQYLVHDQLAAQYGNQTLRITTRQSIQLHGILKGNVRSTIQELNSTLISTLAACGDVNRNVMACPAPAANRTHAQIQEIAYKIAMHLAPKTKAYHEIWLDNEKVPTGQSEDEEVEDIYGKTYLPRKFKIGVAYPGDNCIDVYTQDIGLIARLDGEELLGFTVVIGGGMGATHGKVETHPLLALPFADIDVEQTLKVVETIVTVQRDYGDRTNRKHARMKYVVEERGIPWFRAEVERRLGYQLDDPSEIHLHTVDDHLGWHQQADGRWYLGLNIINGRVKDSETIRLKSGLRAVTEEFQPNIRLTAQQNILLTDIAEEQKSALEQRLAEYNIATDPNATGVYRYAMACPALPTCGQAVAEAERIFPEIVSKIEADLTNLGLEKELISLRMTGCPNGCARPYMGDIGFVGRSKDLYNIHVGGDFNNTRLNTLYAQSVRTENLPATLLPLFVLWRDERQPGEGFGNYSNRVGIAYLKEKAAQPQQVG